MTPLTLSTLISTMGLVSPVLPIDAPIAPEIVHVGLVHPSILAVVLEHGRVTIPGIIPYKPQEGDEVLHREDRTRPRWLRRDGQPIGALAGPELSHLWQYDIFENIPLTVEMVSKPGNWMVSTDGDPLQVLRVDRKSKPIGMARTGEWDWGWPMRHTFYLHLQRTLVHGETITVSLTGHEPGIAPLTWTFVPEHSRSLALAVSHVGFAPEDTKTAFLSQWRGDGGPTDFPADLPFRVVDEKSGETIYRGMATAGFRKGTPEDAYGVDHTRTDVHWLDFSALRTPGLYRIVIDSIGASWPFPIESGVYEALVQLTAHGLFIHRSGIELGPPHTTFLRPRPMHPADGFRVYAANTFPHDEAGSQGAQHQNSIFERLQQSPKEEVLTNAWGGYMDAGDWDRRVDHLLVSRYFFELAEIRPEFVRGLKLNIPESGGDLPDLLEEALWGLDCYRRMQTEEGGVRGWIESVEHPRHGEVSWLESLDVFATLPDPHASYLYAATAAQAATTLRAFGDSGRADMYLETARRAFAWSEDNRTLAGYEQRTRDPRNLAAVMLYRETGESRFHDLFLATTAFQEMNTPVMAWGSHNQREAAFHYIRLENRATDSRIKANALAATLREAREFTVGAYRHGFRWSADPNAPIHWGRLGGPHVWSAARAFVLTGDVRYRETVQLAMGFILGANPFGQSTITGVGHDPARNPLHLDSRHTGQPAPAGIHTYGPADPDREREAWAFPLIADHVYPEHPLWPSVEAYFDVFWIVMSNEYTVQQTIGPNLYLLGLLAPE